MVEQDFEDGRVMDNEDEEEQFEDKDEMQEGEKEVNEEKTTYKECLDSLAKVRSFCQQEEVESCVYDCLTKVQNQCLLKASESKKQKKITEFFF